MTDISLIVPVYNTEQYIGRLMRSVKRQTKSEGVECILVNDGTPDNSMALVQKELENYHGPIRFRLLHHERNRGSAAARNTGLDAAIGRYILMVDSDDWIEPDALEKMYDAASRTDADIAVADFYLTYSSKEIYRTQIVDPLGDANMAAVLRGTLHGANWNKMIRRELFTRHEVRYEEGIDMWEDLMTTARLFHYARNIVHVPRAFVHYVQYNPASYTQAVSQKSLNNMRDATTFLEKFIREKGLSENMTDALNCLKLSVKLNLLIHTDGKQQSAYNELYPECRAALWHHGAMSIYWRTALYFAFRKQLSLFNLFVRIKKRLVK